MTDREIQIVKEYGPRAVNGPVREREFKKLHSALWEWRSRNLDKRQSEWPGWSLIPGEVQNSCFACYWTHEKCARSCMYCPVEVECLTLLNDFIEACENNNYETAQLLAGQIADCWQ